ncbi:uncharacterized protein N0V89_003938 [Didymosphaeria variabile]|uniref:Uncharacterized protein n=1 Tax=Didymosphaeria variabile TaxID=1932322 RepID=A0A9W9CCT1_9PLEO|nr:uncharacterized protein N0V89_003938 [Didymosphaeria variabile]KAJ4355913.1 hypothetical protein N0V89_003938 [Didymosphaeria variabile]
MTESIRLYTAQTYLSSFSKLSVPSFSSVLSDTYTHTYAPSSLVETLNREGYPDKSAFLDHIRSIARLMTGFPVTPIQMIEDEKQNAVWAWTKSKTEWKREVIDEDNEWDYKGEYVFMFWLDESGTKIEKCVEMLDSWATRERLLILSAKARENIKRRTGEEFDWLNKV